MYDEDKVVEALKDRTADQDRIDTLRLLLSEIKAAYDKGSSDAVAELCNGKTKPLKDSFDSAYDALKKMMGI